MKIKQKIAGLALIVSMLTGTGHAQTNESVVNWEADIAGLSALSAGDVPKSGTFWLVTPPNGNNGGMLPPYPCLPTDFDPGNIYTLPSGAFLVDATGGNDGTDSLQLAAQILSVSNLIQQSETVATSQAMGMHAMDLSGPPGFTDTNGDGYTPSDVTNTPIAIDYGTNLWIAQWNLAANNATGIASNTVADISYELMTNSDLTTTNWGHSGQFILGSEATNWTALNSFAVSLTNNLFFRLLSYVSSDGSGIPDWWELEYFGTTGIDPYGNPAGDGYSNLYKYQHGMNPNVFYQPAAPQGFTATYNASTATANISWLPSPGDVTNYELTTPSGTVNLPPTTTSYPDIDPNIAASLNNFFSISQPTFTLVADYYNGPSSAAQTSLAATSPSIWLVQGAQGSNFLAAAVSALPPGTVAIRLAHLDLPVASFSGSNDIPLTSFTNGIYYLPPALTTVPADGSGYGGSTVIWSVQTINSNGAATSRMTELGDSSSLGDGLIISPSTPMPLNPIYLDGRVQLKQNLKFLLRAATVDDSFGYYSFNGDYYDFFIGPPRTFSTNYAEASFYRNQSLDENSFSPNSPPALDNFQPFEDNYLYENCGFSSSLHGGQITTGVFPIGFLGDDYMVFSNIPAYTFTPPTISGTPVAALGPDQATWLLTGENAFNPDFAYEIGVHTDYADGVVVTNTMFNATNIFGLPYVSIKMAWSNDSSQTLTLYPGDSTTQNGWMYPQTAQPGLQTVEYDFWNYNYSGDVLPEESGFSPTNQSDNFLITSVGSTLLVAGYAKMAVTNGYPGTYGYVGQYFTNAYVIGTNGIPTTNTTGILSPFGAFFPTEPGPVALVTMPDIDPPYEQGTCTVSCVSLNVDKNHDGTMDLSLFGADVTSQSSPMEFWINNDNDGTGIGQDIDAPNFPDSANDTIQSMRDLEDFTRLWICGVPALTNDYQVTLSWTNISNGNPSIKLFPSREADGGTEYLTDTNLAINYVGNPLIEPCFGTVTNGVNFQFNSLYFTTGGAKYLMFEGVTAGAGELVLTISDGNGNQIAQTGVWLDLHDIKDFFEQAIITNNINGSVSNWTSAVEMVQPAITPGMGVDTNIIVLIHGINVPAWDAISDGETVLKRLYWAGYQGKFCTVKWPCEFFNLWTLLETDTSVFNRSEMKAYTASTALASYLTQLNSRFPNHRLNLLVHSQGNAITSEAIEQSGVSFNTYILTQGALPDSSYDVDAPTNSSLLNAQSIYATPESQPMGYQGIYTNFTGRIVNFYNPLDPVLDYWVTDQEAGKPDGYAKHLIEEIPPLIPVSPYYSYDGANGWYNTPIGFGTYQITDPEESRAFISRSLTLPIGQSGPASAHGVIKTAVDLNANYNFGNSFPGDHSAQWVQPIQTSLPYYQQVLLQIQPTP